jgi:hypothetical protein
MKTRLAVSLVTLGAVALLLGAAARESRPAEPAFCGEFTPARLLQDPEIAGQVYGAITRGDHAAAERFQALVGEMRAVHGCGELHGPAAALPEDVHRAPRLPPGHPPIGRTPATPIFSADPQIVSI